MKTTKTKRALAAVCAAIALSSVGLAGCSDGGNMVTIETPYGTMKAVLYDDTPLHKANFMKLAREGAYDSLLFHRVLRDNIIQGGDPNSRGAAQGQLLGSGQIGSDIKAEIVYPKHFHRRGALAAARKGDASNPDKMSSGSQFYIVQGSLQTATDLDNVAVVHDNITRRKLYTEVLAFYQDTLQALQDAGKAQEMSDMHMHIIERVEELTRERGLFQFPDEVREAYETVGGLPQLDGDYTVFGEIVEGLDIIDSIAMQPVRPPHMRPYEDTWMVIRPAD